MKRYELRATLSVDGVAPAQLGQLERAMIDAFHFVSAEYPALDSFFARAQADQAEIEIGLRFDGVKERYAEDVANEIVDKVIARLQNTNEDSHTTMERESSLLIPA